MIENVALFLYQARNINTKKVCRIKNMILIKKAYRPDEKLFC